MFLFPIYFAMVPGLVGLDDASSSSGPSGKWTVSFTEETLTQSETTDALSDGDTHEDTFVITEEMIGDGKILPDALLIPQGSTAKDLAYAVHTDLGDGFIRAIDARSGRVIGADHELANDDVVKIHAKT